MQVEHVSDAPHVRVVRIPAGPWEFIPKEQIYEVLPELAKNMVQFIRQNGLQYDLFHGHYVDAGIVTVDVAKALQKPAFFTEQSLGAWKRKDMSGDPHEMERRFRFNHRISEELRVFKSVVVQTVTTEVQREAMEQLYGWRTDNVVIIPPGVDAQRFHPMKDDETTIASKLPPRYVFNLGRIDSNKGHDLLLNAFDIVQREMPQVDLVIGGGSSKPQKTELELIASMKQIIQEKQMVTRVHILGYVPDEHLVSYYQRSELFVLPSIFEPFGMTALEAMACGKPVVASKLGGIREVISSGQDGLLVDPSNTGELASTMIDLLKDPERVRCMGLQGRKKIEEEYSWDAIANRHLEFYERFL